MANIENVWINLNYRKKVNEIMFYRLVGTLCFHLVIESGQRFDEDIDALVAKLVPSGGEEEQSFILQRFN